MQGYLVAERAEWVIPAYARDMLWISDGMRQVPARGERGAFDLPAGATAAPILRLEWGAPGGPPLAQWAIAAEADGLTLDWAGMVAIGGFVERLHVREVRGLALLIAEVNGRMLPEGIAGLPTLEDFRRGAELPGPEDHPELPEYRYPVLTPADGVLADYLHHALVSELAVDCHAVLGPQAGRWQSIVGLPLLLEGLTLWGPGTR